jgi:hypothetical protein
MVIDGKLMNTELVLLCGSTTKEYFSINTFSQNIGTVGKKEWHYD